MGLRNAEELQPGETRDLGRQRRRLGQHRRVAQQDGDDAVSRRQSRGDLHPDPVVGPIEEPRTVLAPGVEPPRPDEHEHQLALGGLPQQDPGEVGTRRDRLTRLEDLAGPEPVGQGLVDAVSHPPRVRFAETEEDTRHDRPFPDRPDARIRTYRSGWVRGLTHIRSGLNSNRNGRKRMATMGAVHDTEPAVRDVSADPGAWPGPC